MRFIDQALVACFALVLMFQVATAQTVIEYYGTSSGNRCHFLHNDFLYRNLGVCQQIGLSYLYTDGILVGTTGVSMRYYPDSRCEYFVREYTGCVDCIACYQAKGPKKCKGYTKPRKSDPLPAVQFDINSCYQMENINGFDVVMYRLKSNPLENDEYLTVTALQQGQNKETMIDGSAIYIDYNDKKAHKTDQFMPVKLSLNQSTSSEETGLQTKYKIAKSK